MKRKIFAATLAAFSLFSVFSASARDNERKVAWGIKVSADVEIPGKWFTKDVSENMFDPGFGCDIGGAAKVNLGNWWHFETGLSVFYSQYRYKDFVVLNDDYSVAQSDPGLYKVGVELPLLFGYTIDVADKFNIAIFTGPQFRYAFAGKIKLDKQFEGHADEWGPDLWGANGQKRFDFGWKFGAGIPFGQWFASVSADFGISNLLKHKIKYQENRVSLSLTRYF